jgi:hypothetical protein
MSSDDQNSEEGFLLAQKPISCSMTHEKTSGWQPEIIKSKMLAISCCASLNILSKDHAAKMQGLIHSNAGKPSRKDQLSCSQQGIENF